MSDEAKPLTILLSLAAAGCFAAAVVLQQRVTVAQGARFALVRQPRWMAGIAADVAGFGLQAIALHLGSLTLVQPLLTTTLLFGLVFNRSRLRRKDWLGALVLAVGLGGFLAAAAPRGGGPIHARLLAVATLATAALVCVVLLRPRVLGLAAGAAVCFGLTAGLVKAAAEQVTAHGLVYPMRHWQVYALAVASLVGLVLEQKSFAGDRLVATLVVLTLGDPLTSLALGVLVEGEALRGGPTAVAAVVAGVLATAGVVELARSPAVLHAHLSWPVPPPGTADDAAGPPAAPSAACPAAHDTDAGG